MQMAYYKKVHDRVVELTLTFKPPSTVRPSTPTNGACIDPRLRLGANFVGCSDSREYNRLGARARSAEMLRASATLLLQIRDMRHQYKPCTEECAMPIRKVH